MRSTSTPSSNVLLAAASSALSTRSGEAASSPANDRRDRAPDTSHPRASALRARLKFRNMIANNKAALLVRCGESTISNARLAHARHKEEMIVFEKKTAKMKRDIQKEVHSFSVDQLMVARSADAHLDMQQVGCGCVEVLACAREGGKESGRARRQSLASRLRTRLAADAPTRIEVAGEWWCCRCRA